MAIYIISNRLTEEDKQVTFEEAKRTTAWVYEVIKKDMQILMK